MIHGLSAQAWSLLREAGHLSVWLALLVAVFVPLEWLGGLHGTKLWRKQVGVDLCWYFINSLVPAVVLGFPLALLSSVVQRLNPGGFYAAVAAWPFWLRLFLVLLVSDVGAYWGHRAMHSHRFLWRFHALHHSAEEMDWLVNTRAHPFDTVFVRFAGLAPVYLLGLAQTASQGVTTEEELRLRPAYRIGQLLESTPGLIVTVHSGEAKANQYYVRGFLLDHGTDIAISVDEMPVNRPTNAHGQGYSDLNFLAPELLGGVDFGKGPFYGAVGDFGAVAYDHLKLVDFLPNQIDLSAGTLGDQEGFVGGTRTFGSGDRLIAAADYEHLDGPWDHPDNFHKIMGALRYVHGAEDDGYSLTALYYWGHSNLTTDQPERAVQQGLIGQYGTLDPSDGARSERFSLSGRYATKGEHWALAASAYYIKSSMTLWNDYTHFLDDPIAGDQEQQSEDRQTAGGQSTYTYRLNVGSVASDTTVGLQGRYDDVYVDRRHTHDRQVLGYCEAEQDGGPALAFPAVDGACDADRARIGEVGLYGQNTTHWLPWLRTVLGLREDYEHAFDHSFISGFSGATDQALFQPKGSLILGPWRKTEVYLSAGRGFHSNDVRGVFQTVSIEGVPVAAGRTPLLSPATAYEAGLRSDLTPTLSAQTDVFREDFQSELAYDQDEGQDDASAPSRRYGIEASAQYRPYPWLELNTDLTWAHARYRGDLSAFGLDGPYIANAPDFIGSVGMLVNGLGPWFGGLEWRVLGAYPVSDGDKTPQDPGYSELNLNAGYRFNRTLKVQVDLFNLTNTHANASAADYISRLPGEPAVGVADHQNHPLEPISARFSLTAAF